jgi:F1F0 ATPase subunit 2
MTWYAALTTGIGLGLVYFSGLWWSVRRLLRSPVRSRWFVASLIARVALTGLVLFALSHFGVEAVVFALAGFWLARWHLFRQVGGFSYG